MYLLKLIIINYLLSCDDYINTPSCLFNMLFIYVSNVYFSGKLLPPNDDLVSVCIECCFELSVVWMDNAIYFRPVCSDIEEMTMKSYVHLKVERNPSQMEVTLVRKICQRKSWLCN